MGSIVTIFVRHNGLERELLYNINMCVCIYLKSIVSQKNGDDAHHVSCLQFSLFSLGPLHFLFLY